MQKLGGIKGILSMLPGVRKAKKALENSNLEDKTFLRMCAIISSMTKKEKKNPKIINGSRKKRIANGHLQSFFYGIHLLSLGFFSLF